MTEVKLYFYENKEFIVMYFRFLGLGIKLFKLLFKNIVDIINSIEIGRHFIEV